MNSISHNQNELEISRQLLDKLKNQIISNSETNVSESIDINNVDVTVDVKPRIILLEECKKKAIELMLNPT